MDEILLVEDNADDAALTLRALQRTKVATEVVHVTDGVQALAYLRRQGEFADRDSSQVPVLMLLDLKLPLIDGLEVLRQVRAEVATRRMPVVVLTTSMEESDLATSYDLGANGYVRKPVDFAEFVSAVQSLGAFWLTVNEQPPGA